MKKKDLKLAESLMVGRLENHQRFGLLDNENITGNTFGCVFSFSKMIRLFCVPSSLLLQGIITFAAFFEPLNSTTARRLPSESGFQQSL